MGRPTGNVVCGSKLGEILLELQKPKLEIKKVVDNICNYDEKMAFLEQCTIGEANRIVARYSFLTADVGYPAEWKELSHRYGDVDIGECLCEMCFKLATNQA